MRITVAESGSSPVRRASRLPQRGQHARHDAHQHRALDVRLRRVLALPDHPGDTAQRERHAEQHERPGPLAQQRPGQEHGEDGRRRCDQCRPAGAEDDERAEVVGVAEDEAHEPAQRE
jgi:hypothetical protein